MKTDLLSQLEKVRRTGDGTWVACCPAHNDSTPSMTVRECNDGRWLIHCFGGCEPLAILDALGMRFEDLFPEPIEHAKPMRRPFPAADVLEAISFEIAVVLCFLAVRSPSQDERDRFRIAVGRIEEARRIANG